MMLMPLPIAVVVPCYHLVWYNVPVSGNQHRAVVVPCYHLVWYN